MRCVRRVLAEGYDVGDVTVPSTGSDAGGPRLYGIRPVICYPVPNTGLGQYVARIPGVAGAAAALLASGAHQRWMGSGKPVALAHVMPQQRLPAVSTDEDKGGDSKVKDDEEGEGCEMGKDEFLGCEEIVVNSSSSKTATTVNADIIVEPSSPAACTGAPPTDASAAGQQGLGVIIAAAAAAAEGNLAKYGLKSPQDPLYGLSALACLASEQLHKLEAAESQASSGDEGDRHEDEDEDDGDDDSPPRPLQRSVYSGRRIKRRRLDRGLGGVLGSGVGGGMRKLWKRPASAAERTACLKRTAFTSKQTAALKNFFFRSPNASRLQMSEMAAIIGCSVRAIQVYFQRAKAARQQHRVGHAKREIDDYAGYGGGGQLTSPTLTAAHHSSVSLKSEVDDDESGIDDSSEPLDLSVARPMGSHRSQACYSTAASDIVLNLCTRSLLKQDSSLSDGDDGLSSSERTSFRSAASSDVSPKLQSASRRSSEVNNVLRNGLQ